MQDYTAHAPAIPLSVARRGQPEYAACCRLMYACYRATHAALNSLTAAEAFYAQLSAEALYESTAGQIRHAAFVEGNEIAYIASADADKLLPFAAAVVTGMFAAHETIRFEYDDCDPAATAHKSLFHCEAREIWDTYVLEGK